MRQELTTEYAKKVQEEARWAYNQALEKFYFSMLEVVFLRIKSHLNEQGLKKVVDLDERRRNNENLSIDFSQKTWKVLSESWVVAEGVAMKKIADLCGLDISDLDMSKIEKMNNKPSSPRCDPTTK